MPLPRLLPAVVLAAVAATAVGVTPALAASGLSVSPSTIERDVQPGSLGTVHISNGSSKTLDVVVRARPWIQSRTGTVRPDDSRQLKAIRLGASTFKLAPGQSRDITITLLARPASGSLYGTVSVIGTPEGAAPKNGVRTRYRLLAGLRLNPPASSRRYRVTVGGASYRSGATLLAVRNTGNTVEPVSGTATISGPSGTRRASFTALRILPNVGVDLRLPGNLGKGKYKVAVTLDQAGRRVAALGRSLRVG